MVRVVLPPGGANCSSVDYNPNLKEILVAVAGSKPLDT